MKPSEFICKTSGKHKHIRKKRILILKISTHLRIENKVNTTKRKTIYKVIEEDYFKESDIFPDD